MAREEKPYRVYRGGRAKGKVPTSKPRPGRTPSNASAGRGEQRVDYRGPGGGSRTGRRTRWGRIATLAALVLLVLVVVWGVLSWFAFSRGVSDANKRLDQNAKTALVSQNGLLMSHPTTILMLGTDNARVGGREGDRHSDS